MRLSFHTATKEECSERTAKNTGTVRRCAPLGAAKQSRTAVMDGHPPDRDPRGGRSSQTSLLPAGAARVMREVWKSDTGTSQQRQNKERAYPDNPEHHTHKQRERLSVCRSSDFQKIRHPGRQSAQQLHPPRQSSEKHHYCCSAPCGKGNKEGSRPSRDRERRRISNPSSHLGR